MWMGSKVLLCRLMGLPVEAFDVAEAELEQYLAGCEVVTCDGDVWVCEPAGERLALTGSLYGVEIV